MLKINVVVCLVFLIVYTTHQLPSRKTRQVVYHWPSQFLMHSERNWTPIQLHYYSQAKFMKKINLHSFNGRRLFSTKSKWCYSSIDGYWNFRWFYEPTYEIIFARNMLLVDSIWTHFWHKSIQCLPRRFFHQVVGTFSIAIALPFDEIFVSLPQLKKIRSHHHPFGVLDPSPCFTSGKVQSRINDF